MSGRMWRWARACLFALLPLLLLVLLLELALWAAGLGSPDSSLSLTRGFDPRAPYLLPVADQPGAYVTQMFEGSAPEVHIPPKGECLRVLMLGGSNTQGFPRAWLEEQLNARAPEPGFEVINLGRQGYGSERVAILAAQASVLEPDVLLVYLGHNEFVEAGFMLELVRQWGDARLMRLGAALAHFRTLNVLTGLLRSPARAPEPRSKRSEEFRDLHYAQTQAFYRQYRARVRELCRRGLADGAEVVLSTVVWNHFDPPTVVSVDPWLAPAQARRVKELCAAAAAAIPERFARGVIQRAPLDEIVRLRPEAWGEAIAPEEREARSAQSTARPVPSLRLLSGAFAGGPFWLDSALWTEPVHQLLATHATFFERSLLPGEAEALSAAIAALEEALALSPDHPQSLFQLGWCLWLTGQDDARAASLLREAARFDRAPTHGNDATNDILREIAAELPRVHFVDTEAAVSACHPQGLVGLEIMLDNCHLHSPARPLLLECLLPALLEAGRRAAAH